MHHFIFLSFILISFSSLSQIWDFPPAPTKPYEPNQYIKRKNVKFIKTYEYKLNNGLRTKEIPKIEEQLLDTTENTIYFTENNNKIFLKIDTSLYLNIKYDSFSRPVRQTIQKQNKYWKYNIDKLTEYSIFISNELIEKREFSYKDSILIYTICYPNYNLNTCDSVISKLDKNKNPINIKYINYINNKPSILELNLLYDKQGNNLGGTFGCERIEFHYSKDNYRTKMKKYDCDGILILDIEYEYEFY